MTFYLVLALGFVCVVFFSLLGVLKMDDKKVKLEKKVCKLCGCKVKLNKECICLECFKWRKRGEDSRE